MFRAFAWSYGSWVWEGGRGGIQVSLSSFLVLINEDSEYLTKITSFEPRARFHTHHKLHLFQQIIPHTWIHLLAYSLEIGSPVTLYPQPATSSQRVIENGRKQQPMDKFRPPSPLLLIFDRQG